MHTIPAPLSYKKKKKVSRLYSQHQLFKTAKPVWKSSGIVLPRGVVLVVLQLSFNLALLHLFRWGRGLGGFIHNVMVIIYLICLYLI